MSFCLTKFYGHARKKEFEDFFFYCYFFSSPCKQCLKLLILKIIIYIFFCFISELLQHEQQEMSAQLASLQSDVRVSYGNDALMPDSTAPLDLLPSEDSEHLGFIHPERFNQPNTQNHGTHKRTHTLCVQR